MKNLFLTAVATVGLTAVTLAQVPSYVPSNGLVGWWPFNGNANDESGNGNNGTVNGATLTNDRFGNVNKAYSFDGINDFIQSTNHSLSGSVTFSCWYRMSSFNLPGNDMFYMTNQSISDDIYSSNIAFGFRSYQGEYGHSTSVNSQSLTGYYATNNLPAINVWHHLVCVFENGSYIKMYLDDVIVYNNNNVVTNSSSISFPILFGGTGTSSFCYYSGELDDIAIWNRALSEQEIIELFNECELSVNTQPVSQTININNNAQFTVGSSDPNASYQWQTDLGVGFQNINSVGQYSGATTNTLTVSNVTMSNNNQPIRCIVSSGTCSDTSDLAVLTVNNNASIDALSNDKLFSVYPNPAQNQLQVKAGIELMNASYSILDNTGRTVLTGQLTSENTVIELSGLSNGTYFLNVGDQLKESFKVLKNE